jgi:hypothetical protein
VTPFARFLSRIAEKITDRYYEGPEEPQRLAEEVRLFRAMYPAASPEEWADFTARLAGNAYRAGYTRGFEYAERDPNPPEPDLQQLEQHRHDWSLSDGHPLMREVVEAGRRPVDPYADLTPEERAEYLDAVGQLQGTHRVERLDARGMPLADPNG